MSPGKITQQRVFAYITNQDQDTLSVLDTRTNRIMKTIRVGQLPNSVAVSPDGKRIFTTNGAGDSVTIISTGTNLVVQTVKGVGAEPFAVDFSLRRNRYYVPSFYSGSLFVLDIQTNRVLSEIPVGNGPVGVAVSPDENSVYVTSVGAGISIINADTDRVVGTVAEMDSWGIDFSPDGSTYYVNNVGSNSVSMYDARSNKPLQRTSVGLAPIGIVVSGDGRRVYTANSRSRSVSVIDAATLRIMRTVSVGAVPFGVAITPDNRTLYVTNFGSSTVSVIDTATNRVVDTIRTGFNPRGIAITPLRLQEAPNG
ncbi:hypothetical protein M3223_12635 [Paenibacillus pasadenensis]|uniref:YVTN family beta-propeller repeat protein n=1 Tax=Paenibacillus pasadenensis TaxID=217090 RepID=UPI00203EF8B0|nr:hypothetical protein [Paenibacillus pasadenensis]MCM3748201.1 hypothetical protein [Paenibacillus pasadenensis]